MNTSNEAVGKEIIDLFNSMGQVGSPDDPQPLSDPSL